MFSRLRLISAWLPVLIYAGLIWALSSRPMPEQLPVLPFIDKLLHVGLYAGLGALVCRALAPTPSPGRRWRPLLFSGLLCAVYGVCDEWHQSAVPTRMADPVDVMADLAGGLLGAEAWLRWQGGRLAGAARGLWIDRRQRFPLK